MSLKQQISEALKASMKAKDIMKLNVLRVLKSEIERQEQGPNGKVELTDGAIVAIVKKIIEGVKEVSPSSEEIPILEAYLPKQLTTEELNSIALSLKEGGFKSVGEFMKHFKANHDGMYDGKTLSTIIKNILV